MMNRRLRKLVMVAALIISAPLSAYGQEAPSEAQLAESLAFEIPAIWSVETLTIQAAQNLGTIVDPDIRMRIRATARLQQPTFGFAAQIDNVTVLAPLLPEDHTIDVFGFASARLYRGEWEIQFDFQGDPFHGSGAPRSSFSGRTVLQDSDEHRSVIEEAEAHRRAALEAQRAAIARDGEHWRTLLGRGEFRGQSSIGGTVWPFEVVDVVFDANDRFTAELTWLTLSSVQRISGMVSDGRMIFENVEDIQRGEAVLNCIYQLELDTDATASGTFTRCAQGRVSVEFDPEALIAERRAARAAGIVALRDAFTAAATVQARYDEPDGWGCARLPCSHRKVTEFSISLESFDPAGNGFTGEARWPSGTRYAIEGRISGDQVVFRETSVRENPTDRPADFQSYHGRIGAQAVSGIVCQDPVIDTPCPDPFRLDTRFSFAIP